jgi:hypothetical protein
MTRHVSTLGIVLLCAGCGSNKASVDPGLGIAVSGRQMPSRMATSMEMNLGAAGGGYVGGVPPVIGGQPSAGQPGPSQPVDPVSHLAYTYGMRLEVPGDRLLGLMEGHAAACRSAGLRVCQLVASRHDGDPASGLHGSLSLRGEPQWLQRFMKGVQSDALVAAGRVTSQSTTTEDLTREIVDTEATLRAKRALRDRLQQLLATRPGSLADLLGVERELSRVQGEIDATESNLTAMRTRVAMAALTVTYGSIASGVAGGLFEPLRYAVGNFLVAAVDSTGALVTFVGAVLPWVIVGTLLVWLLIRRRRRAREATAAAAPPATASTP